MNNPSLHTLVNFRANRTLLESFDRVCLLTGKTRTQVLAEMMRQRVMSVGSKLPAKLASERAVDERLKVAVEGPNANVTSARPREWLIGGSSNLRKFSECELATGWPC